MNKKLQIVTFVVLVFVLILILFGIINIYKSCKIIQKQANTNLIYQTKEIVDRENDYFYKAEEAVNRCCKMIELTVDLNKLNKIAPVAFKYDEHKIPYVDNYLNKIVAPILLYSAKNIDGIVSIFFDFDHKFLVNKELIGIWYTDKSHNRNFKVEDNGLTSTMLPENRSDLEWYYLPKKLKKGVWSKPYIDDDIKIDMITYSVPVYSKGKFLGVEGVDISMEGLKDFVYSFKLYESGKIYLIGKDNKIIFAKDYKPLTSIENVDKNLYKFLDKIDAIKLENQDVKLIKSYSGKKLFAVSRLENGFIIAVEVAIDELYEETYKLITFTSLFLIFIVLVSLIVAYKSYAKLKKINNELIHKEKLISMGTMAAEVAHEINTPLGYLNCNIDTLKDFLDRVKKFMNICETQFDRILKKEISVEQHIQEVRQIRNDFKLDYILEDIDDLINESKYGIRKVSAIVFNLKNFSKDDSCHQKSVEKVDLIVNDALKILANKISSTVNILTVFEEMPPLLCNKNQILQVLVNVVDNAYNALKCKGDKEKKIIILCYKKGPNAYIEVEDNGEGIEKSKINKIFDAFYTTKIEQGGTGLGLSVVYHIISNKHNGEISVQSKKGQGSKFIIKIPYQKNKNRRA